MKEMKGYMDLHTHTCISDGNLTPSELVKLARSYDITVLAITDHNKILSKEEVVKLMEEAGGDIRILRASEVSCKYQLPDRVVELHVIALFPDMDSDTRVFEELLRKSTGSGRRIYIEGILEKLRLVEVDIGTYDELVKKYPNHSLGRPQIATEIVNGGYAETVEEAMDEYIGTFGKRRAFFENPLKKQMPDLEEVINAIKACGGMAVLAHLYYYNLEESEEHVLLEKFSRLAGMAGGMEVNYRKYNEEQRKKLAELAQEYHLFASSASDYHGVYESDGMDNYFPAEQFDEIIECWNKIRTE